MPWNYRVVKKIVEVKTEVGPKEYVEFAIHEAYYNPDGSLHSLTEDQIEPYGETLEELKDSYALMGHAFEKPVLDFDTGKELI